MFVYHDNVVKVHQYDLNLLVALVGLVTNKDEFFLPKYNLSSM